MTEPGNGAEVEVGLARRVVAPELDKEARLGKWLAAAENENASDKALERLGAAASLRFFLAGELGLTPLAAAELSVVRGRLVVSAKLVRALANKAGYKVTPKDWTSEACTAVLTDENENVVGEYTYTMEMARTAKLVKSGGAYETSPERMMWARAAKRVIDDFKPEVSLGLLTEEEAEEILDAEPVDSDDESGGSVQGVEGGATGPDAPPPDPPADEPDAPEPEDAASPATADQRKRFWALVKTDLKPWPAPSPHHEWEAYARMKMSEWYDGASSITELDVDQADELLTAMSNRLKEMQAAGPPPEPENTPEEAADAAAAALAEMEADDPIDF